jgi:hypothetical protein
LSDQIVLMEEAVALFLQVYTQKNTAIFSQ